MQRFKQMSLVSSSPSLSVSLRRGETPARNQTPESRRGFTLVELLVVIAIIGVLVGLLLPAVQAAREAARRMSCSNNMKQLGLALHMYHDTNLKMPPASFQATVTNQRPASWLVRILPFMEQRAAYDQSTFAGTDWASRSDGTNLNWQAYHGLQVPALNCPSSPLPTTRTDAASSSTVALGAPANLEIQVPSYVGVAGDFNSQNVQKSIWNGHHGMSDYNGMIISIDNRNTEAVRFASITDGTSNTLAIGEQSDYMRVREADGSFSKYDQRAGNWWGGAWSGGGGGSSQASEGYWMNISSTRVGVNYVSTQGRYTPHGIGPYWYGRPGHHTVFGSAHPGGAQFTLGDGSVRFVSENIRFDILSFLANRADGEVINGEF